MTGASKTSGMGAMLGIVVMLLLPLIPLMVMSPERLGQFIMLEQGMYGWLLGTEVADAIQSRADDAYLSAIAQEGDAGSLDNEYLASRSEAFKMMLYLLCYRMAFVGSWDILAALFIVACVVDGQMRRKVGQWDFRFVSPMKRQVSKTLVLVGIAGLILALSLPLPLPPLAMPLAVIGFGFALRMAASSMQKRV